MQGLPPHRDHRLAYSFIFYVAALLFFGVGAITTLGLKWYAGLVKPLWTPPDLMVALIWILLFITTALSVSLFWSASLHRERKFALTLGLYAANSLLVLLWNYLFFGLNRLDLAWWSAIAVGASIVLLMLHLWRNHRAAALLLLPYLAWMVFALAFTHTLLVLN